jgi:hypothetical protein
MITNTFDVGSVNVVKGFAGDMMSIVLHGKLKG